MTGLEELSAMFWKGDATGIGTLAERLLGKGVAGQTILNNGLGMGMASDLGICCLNFLSSYKLSTGLRICDDDYRLRTTHRESVACDFGCCRVTLSNRLIKLSFNVDVHLASWVCY